MKEWEVKVEGQTDWVPWENPAANGTAPARSDDEDQDDEGGQIAGGDREEVEEERRRQDEVTEEEADEATQREAAGLAEGQHMLIEELEAELQARRLDSPIDGGAEDEDEPTFATRQARAKKAGSKKEVAEFGIYDGHGKRADAEQLGQCAFEALLTGWYVRFLVSDHSLRLTNAGNTVELVIGVGTISAVKRHTDLLVQQAQQQGADEAEAEAKASSDAESAAKRKKPAAKAPPSAKVAVWTFDLVGPPEMRTRQMVLKKGGPATTEMKTHIAGSASGHDLRALCATLEQACKDRSTVGSTEGHTRCRYRLQFDLSKDRGTEERFYDSFCSYTPRLEKLAAAEFPPKPMGYSAAQIEENAAERCIVKEAVFPFNSNDPATLKTATTTCESIVRQLDDPAWRQERTCSCCRRPVHTGELGDVVLNLDKEIATAGSDTAALMDLLVRHELFERNLSANDMAVGSAVEVVAGLRRDLSELGHQQLVDRAKAQVHHRCFIVVTELYARMLKRLENAGLVGVWSCMKAARAEGMWRPRDVVKRAHDLWAEKRTAETAASAATAQTADVTAAAAVPPAAAALAAAAAGVNAPAPAAADAAAAAAAPAVGAGPESRAESGLEDPDADL